MMSEGNTDQRPELGKASARWQLDPKASDWLGRVWNWGGIAAMFFAGVVQIVLGLESIDSGSPKFGAFQILVSVMLIVRAGMFILENTKERKNA